MSEALTQGPLSPPTEAVRLPASVVTERRVVRWLLIAVATGLGALAFGAPFLSSSFGHVHVPLIGEVELATAMLFDFGVATVVVGAVMMALAQLAHVSQRAAREPDGEEGA